MLWKIPSVLPGPPGGAGKCSQASKRKHFQLGTLQVSWNTGYKHGSSVCKLGKAAEVSRLGDWKAMPLFGNTFSPKKTPPRKSASLSNLHLLDRSTREIELGLEYGTPNMNLTGQNLKFENGQWIAESGSSSGDRRETQRLRKRNQQLEEENNLLRLKVDILLDMLSETTAESHLMEKELEDLKSHSRRRK